MLREVEAVNLSDAHPIGIVKGIIRMLAEDKTYKNTTLQAWMKDFLSNTGRHYSPLILFDETGTLDRITCDPQPYVENGAELYGIVVPANVLSSLYSDPIDLIEQAIDAVTEARVKQNAAHRRRNYGASDDPGPSVAARLTDFERHKPNDNEMFAMIKQRTIIP